MHPAAAGRTSVRHWIEIENKPLRNNKAEIKVILAAAMASAIIAAGQE